MTRAARSEDADPSGPVVACPACGKSTPFHPSNRWRPFCSERCRTIDLGAWASNAYVVPGSPADSDEDAPLSDETGKPPTHG